MSFFFVNFASFRIANFANFGLALNEKISVLHGVTLNLFKTFI